MESFFVEYMIPAAYIFIGLCILGIVVGFVISCVNNPKILLKSLISAVILAIIFAVGFFLSGTETSANMKIDVSQETIRIVGAMLIMAYIMISVAILGIIINWLSNLIR